MKTRRMVLDGMLIALYFVLGYYLVLNLGNMKITLEAFPILVAALLLGPIDGLLVGGLGALLIQLLSYGITPTTILWIAPHALSGLLVGLAAKSRWYQKTRGQTIALCIASALLVTALNTLALVVDSKMYGYYSAAILAAIPMRILTGIITAVVFGAALPILLERLEKLRS